MSGLPAPVRDFLQTYIQDTRSPAYLVVDKGGRLRDWGGKLSTYGITRLRKGAAITGGVHCLEGLLPLDDSPMYVPCVETASGMFADIHIFPAHERDWVLFLDATADAVQRRLLQQRANDLSLLQEYQAKVFSQDAGAQLPRDPVQSLRQAVTNVSLLAQLFAALEIVAMERLPDQSFRPISAVPAWFKRFAPDVHGGQEVVRPGRLFPFLENFLVDAERFWQEQDSGRLPSGIWMEIDPLGNAYALEAFAVCLGRRKLLLMALAQSVYEEKHAIIQRARENNLESYRLSKEIQKKEILLHCIVHDLAGPLTSIMLCLSLLKFENLSATGRAYVDLGIRQATKQDILIQQILDIFAAELGALQAYTTDPAQAPDAVLCAREVVEALTPACMAKEMRLSLEARLDARGNWQVVGEKSRLERVIFNLVDNALRHGPVGSVVTVGVRRDGDGILVTVDDEGAGVPPDVAKTVFDKFSQGRERAGRAGLGLYFCRLTIEHWGGSIGYTPRSKGGSRFWFRLPRPRRS
ncbi:MAG TPA: HAMP domain-containing sensor histidine kinase [Candidatus Tectomicrobia bacterium]|nr:HAMP domain-containing sensor histidine kinase [Candidatus Tectomicrobia bacterium]